MKLTSNHSLAQNVGLALAVACTACGGDAGSSLADAMDEGIVSGPNAGDELAASDQAEEGSLADASVAFVSPADGDVIEGPVVDGKVAVAIEIDLANAEVRPAGELETGTGHHHVLIDAPAVPAGEFVPFDDQHVHLGQGQTSLELWLTPGEHELTLQFADGVHRSYGPELSDTVTVTVVAGEVSSAAEDRAPPSAQAGADDHTHSTDTAHDHAM